MTEKQIEDLENRLDTKTKACKLLQTMVEVLEKENNELRSRLDDMQTALDNANP